MVSFMSTPLLCEIDYVSVKNTVLEEENLILQLRLIQQDRSIFKPYQKNVCC